MVGGFPPFLVLAEQQQAPEELDESDETESDQILCWPAIEDSDDEPPPMVPSSDDELHSV